MIKGIGLNMISLVGNRNSVTNICNIPVGGINLVHT